MPFSLTNFFANARLEFRSQLRRPTIYVTTALLFLYWVIFAARARINPNFWGPSGEVYCNAPVALYFLFATQSFVTFLFVPLAMGPGPLRELRAKLGESWLATPASPTTALWGRFFAAFVILAFSTLIASIGVLLSPYLSLALGHMTVLKVGPVPWLHLIYAWCTILVPTLFFASSFVFWLVVWTRRSSAAVVATVVLVLGAVISHYMGKTTHFDALQVIDPTAFHAVQRTVEYWSVEQRNHDFLPLTRLFWLNRLLWVGAGLALSGLATVTFRRSRFLFGSQSAWVGGLGGLGGLGALSARKWFRRGSISPRSPAVLEETSALDPASASAPVSRVQQFGFRFRVELRQLLREPLYGAAFLFCLLWLWIYHYAWLKLQFVSWSATPDQLVVARKGLWMLVFHLVPFITASTVFYERNLSGWEHFDTLPIPNWLQWLPKLAALMVYCALFPLAVLLASLLTQALFQGGFAEGAAYLQVLLGSYYLYLLQFVVFSFVIALLCPSRAVAFGVTMLVLYVSVFLYESTMSGPELWLQMHETRFSWSTFDDGFGPYAAKVYSKGLFWLAASLAALSLATGFWKRGQLRRWDPRGWGVRVFVALIFAGGAGFLAQHFLAQSSMWQRSRLRPSSAAQRAEYEKTLATFRGDVSPRLSSFDLEIDLEPERGRYHYFWRGRMQGLVDQAKPEGSASLLVQANPGPDLEFRRDGQPLNATLAFPRWGAWRYDWPKSRAPGGELSVRSQHEFIGYPRKRGKALGVVANGSYLGPEALPYFGYDPSLEIEIPVKRSLHGLGARVPEFSSEREALKLPRDCAWPGGAQEWKIQISTAKEQYAVAPGKLQKSWVEGERRYFIYASEAKDCGHMSMASARYEKLDSKWSPAAGPAVDLRVLFLQKHSEAAERVQQVVHQALSKLSEILGPYPYSALQVAETRHDAPLGVSPANVIWLRENEGWTTRVDRPEDEHDLRFYVAYRLAQHWMQNRVAPARAPGKGLFSAGIPAFLALEFLEDSFGEDWLQKKYLRRWMQDYFWYHGIYGTAETSVIASQGVEQIDLHKGSLALRAYAQALGRPKLYAKLRELLGSGAEMGSSAPPWTAAAWQASLDAAFVSDSGLSLPSEMMSEILHYDNRLVSATAQLLPDGQYQIDLSIEANRWQNLGQGEEAKLVPWVRPLPLGLYFDPRGEEQKLHLVEVKNGLNHIQLRLSKKPHEVVIDPKIELLDISLKDQKARVKDGH